MAWKDELSKWEVPALMFVAGFLLLYFSFFVGLPNPGNAWTPALRGRPDLGLLFLGICFCGGSVVLTVIADRPRREAAPAEEPAPAVTTVEATPPEVVEQTPEPHQPEEEEPPRDPKQHPFVLLWLRLSTTQKEIVVFLYEHSHREKIPFDDFYDAFCSKHGMQVTTADEMYFRLKTLEHIGFFNMEAVAEKATYLQRIKKVKFALLNGDIINTG
jgi:hypothetical protein